MPFSRLTTHLPRLRPYARLLTLPLWSAAIASFLNDHFAEVLSVSGRSMAPTLSPLYHETGRKDYLLLRKHNVTTDLKRGDVVAFWAPHKREFLVVKRVVGLEGDLWGDDPLDLHMGLGTNKGAVRVPPGHVWVEGDNWRESGDSNFYGPISRGLITGKAICVLWPWERCGERPWEWPTKDKSGTRVEVAGWGEINKSGYLQE
ncbi:peptidase S24/S26A/S26B/S26C [Elsinoe ampelina]|uniref:Mitochondrial inner membrane protease subunit 2 n=1 Tax=Elsinoe ampelina TaxID=302913 RepID=A0A6A6GBN3_9PEZI|nr:peptidase S24/S26A/S26B/S26C [Elsinoe ampelina]